MRAAVLLLALHSAAASWERPLSYSYSYYWDVGTFAPSAAPTPVPSAMPVPAPTAVPVSAPTAVPVSAPTALPIPVPVPVPTSAPVPAPTSNTPSPTAAPVELSLDLAVDGLDCADYGASEAAVFVEALSTVLGSSASITAGDCTTVSRRRNLLQTSSASLNFAVVVLSLIHI